MQAHDFRTLYIFLEMDSWISSLFRGFPVLVFWVVVFGTLSSSREYDRYTICSNNFNCDEDITGVGIPSKTSSVTYPPAGEASMPSYLAAVKVLMLSLVTTVTLPSTDETTIPPSSSGTVTVYPIADEVPTSSYTAYPTDQGPAVSITASAPVPGPHLFAGIHRFITGNGNRNIKLKIIIGVCAGFASIVALFCIMIIYIHRRRRRLASKTSSTFNKKRMSMESIMNPGPKRYHYSQIKKMTNSFSNKVGEGGYGIVYRGKLVDGTLVAIKLLKVSKSDGEDFINEVMSISRTSHVNIVSLLGFSQNSKKIALVYEFMPNGSLDSFMSGSCNLEMKTLHRIVVGVARGLEYLHCGCRTRIVHFDIKPQNILLDEDFNPKISDFGLAKLCKRNESMISMLGARGTVGFIAPEVFSRAFGVVSYKSDVYSYGMLVLDLILGGRRNPSSRLLSNESETYFPNWIFKELEGGKTIKTDENVTEEEEEMEKKMIIVGLWCIQISPLDRPSMSKVLEMLDGSIQSLQMPPRPSLIRPTMSTQQSISESLSHEVV